MDVTLVPRARSLTGFQERGEDNSFVGDIVWRWKTYAGVRGSWLRDEVGESGSECVVFIDRLWADGLGCTVCEFVEWTVLDGEGADMHGLFVIKAPGCMLDA